MIVNHRIHEPQPGRLRDVLPLYEKEGRPVLAAAHRHEGRHVVEVEACQPAVERLHDPQRQPARLGHALHEAAADERRVLLDDHDGLHATAAVAAAGASAASSPRPCQRCSAA